MEYDIKEACVLFNCTLSMRSCASLRITHSKQPIRPRQSDNSIQPRSQNFYVLPRAKKKPRKKEERKNLHIYFLRPPNQPRLAGALVVVVSTTSAAVPGAELVVVTTVVFFPLVMGGAENNPRFSLAVRLGAGMYVLVVVTERVVLTTTPCCTGAGTCFTVAPSPLVLGLGLVLLGVEGAVL